MKKVIIGIIALIVLGAGVLFATADTKAQKAQKLFAAAQQSIAQKDDVRAMIELRNALQNDPELTGARMLFADLLAKSDRRADAYGQYRQVYIQDPENTDAVAAMALIAFESMAWDDAREYVDKALAKRPDDVTLQAIAAGISYREAVTAKDDDAMSRAAQKEAEILATNPELLIARRVTIADHLRANDLDGALSLTDAGLALAPDDRDMNNTRLFLLERLGRTEEMEQQLLSMTARYPKDEELGRALVRFYVASKRLDDAEKILRSHVDPESDKAEPRMVLLRFLSEIRSPQTMREELAKVLAQDPLPKDVAANLLDFKALEAQTDFALGERDKAMAGLEGLIKGGEPSPNIDRLKVQLARMRLLTGNVVGARALVEEVLTHDPRQTDAMKIKAEWLIGEDQTEPAVALLRDALADRPNDPQIMTLMAAAYEREGRPELMADMLARAVETSNQAPEESLRYASWLYQRGEYTSVETLVIDALRRQPVNLDLLAMLARTHMAMKDWARADQDIKAIAERVPTEQGRAVESQLRAQMLSAQGRKDELTQYLDQIARGSTGGTALAAKMALIRTTVAEGRLEDALAAAQRLKDETPDSVDVAMLVAQLRLAQGQTDEAISDLGALLAAHPDYLPGWQTLQAVQMRAGQPDAALATIDAGLKNLPDNPTLLLSKAYFLEKTGKIDDAIAIYETLYTRSSSNQVIANNLASLLASTREDQESLDRAWTVARRLNGTKVPAFQDTYGWLAFRRGDVASALSELEQASKGLPDDPSVAYHLGRAYAAMKRVDEAKAQYDRAEALLATGIASYPNLADDLSKARAELR